MSSRCKLLSLLAPASDGSYFQVMQRQLPIAIALLSLVSSIPAGVQAQDPVAAAAREEAADNYRVVATKVSRLEEEVLSYQSRMLKLSEETHRLREEVDRQKNRNENAATLEKISKLQDAIKQVDEARQEDNKRVLAEIARLRTLLEKAAKGFATSANSPTTSSPAAARGSSCSRLTPPSCWPRNSMIWSPARS